VLSLDFKPAGAYMPDCTAWRVEEYAKGFVSHKYAPEFGAKSEGAPVSVKVTEVSASNQLISIKPK
jgi:hypothetical protein